MFHRLSKHLEFRQKYSAARRIFNSFLGVDILMKHCLSLKIDEQAAAKTILIFIVILSMLFAFYSNTSISFVLLYLCIFVRYFLTFLYIYIFTSPFYISLFKDCRLAIESSVFLKLLTRERLFNSSTVSLV